MDMDTLMEDLSLNDTHKSKKRKIQTSTHHHHPTHHPRVLIPFERSREGITEAYDQVFASWEEASRIQRRIFDRYMRLSEVTRDQISADIMGGFDCLETLADSLMQVEAMIESGNLDEVCERLQGVYAALDPIMQRSRDVELTLIRVEDEEDSDSS